MCVYEEMWRSAIVGLFGSSSGGGGVVEEKVLLKTSVEKYQKNHHTLFWFCSDFHFGSGEPPPPPLSGPQKAGVVPAAWTLPLPSQLWCWVGSRLSCSCAELRSTPDPAVSCWGLSFIPAVRLPLVCRTHCRLPAARRAKTRLSRTNPLWAIFHTEKKEKWNTVFVYQG